MPAIHAGAARDVFRIHGLDQRFDSSFSVVPQLGIRISDDDDARQRPLILQLIERREPSSRFQIDSEEHDAETAIVEHLQRFRISSRRRHREMILIEGRDQRLAERVIVMDDQSGTAW